MIVVGKGALFLTQGKLYSVINTRNAWFVESTGGDTKPAIEYQIIDDFGTECWHQDSSFYTLEEWRDIKLEELGI